MAKRRIGISKRKKALKHTLLAILAACGVVIGVIALAAGLLHVLGLSHSREEIAIIDNSTEKVAVMDDANIAQPDNAADLGMSTETMENGTGVFTEEDTAASAASFEIKETDQTADLTDAGFSSKEILLINQDTGDIIAQKAADEAMIPSALNKIMTALTAADALGVTGQSDAILEDTLSFPEDTLTYCEENDLNTVGFEADDTVSVKDLFYGTLIPAGADAAYQLALYTSGTAEEFTAQMNQKAAELGLSAATNYIDPIGTIDDSQTSCVKDLAIIMREAMQNEALSTILASGSYLTSSETKFSTKAFSRLASDDIDNILGIKTAYTKESGGCCALSYEGASGTRYILVTAGAEDSSVCADEDAEILQQYAE